jgi:hypothetical protein
MALHFYLGAYWSNRKESAEQCVDRLLDFFGQLKPCSPLLAKWFELGRSRKDALRRPADVEDRKYLMKLLEHGRFEGDDLGFSTGLWNGTDDDHAIGLSFTCGGYSPRVPNCVVVNFPAELGSLSRAETMCSIVAAVARAWEPERAQVASHEARDTRLYQPGKPFVDWMLYLSRDWLPKGTTHLPPWSRAVALGGRLGAIVITQEEPPDPHRRDDVARIDGVRKALGL